MRNTLLCILFLLPLFAQNSIEDKLTNDKADWNFTNTPFIEAIDTIRDAHKINILFAHKIKEKINFRVRDMKLRQALNLFCKVYDLTYSIQGNILFIFSSQQHELQYGFEKIETKVYDLRQISFSVHNDMKFLQLRDKVLLPHDESELIELQEEENSPNAIFENFKEAIQYAVEPNSWDKDPISIDIVEGHGLVIVQTQSVHRKIQQFLKDLRQFSSVAIDVKVWQVSLANEALNERQLYKKSSISQEELRKIIADVSPQDVWLQTQFSIHLWMCVGKTADASQKICAFTTSNRRKVVLKSGQLIMGKTVQDLELRRDFIRGHAYAENLQDHIDKRQSWEMTATPLLRDDTIEIKMNWVWRDKDMFKRHFKIAVKDGKTLLVTSLTPELNLYVGASIVK